MLKPPVPKFPSDLSVRLRDVVEKTGLREDETDSRFSVGLRIALREERRHPGVRGWGQSWKAPAQTPAPDDMHCFRQLCLRLRAPNGEIR